MTELYPRWRWPQLLLANLAIVLAYLATLELGVALHMRPGYIAPVFPPAGIGLALAVVGGWPVLPGIALGALLLHLPSAWLAPQVPAATAALVVLATTVGAALQAWLGARLFRRWVHPALDSPRAVGRFLLLAPAICLISATVAVPSLYHLGLLVPSERVAAWISWWAGDSVGVLLFAPLCWILCAPPRALWRARARIVALPLLLAAAAVVATYNQAVRWESEQHLDTFHIKAQQAADLAQAEFHEHERFVGTFARALADAQGMLTQERFERIANGYVDGRPELRGINWAVRISEAQRPALEAWARRHVDPTFALHDIGPGWLGPARRRNQYLALLYTAPRTNGMVSGMNYLSDPVRADAILRSLRSGRPAATEPLRLIPTGHSGILLFRGVGEDNGQPSGMIVVVIDAAMMVQRAARLAGLADFGFDFADITEPDRLLPVAGAAWPGKQRGEHAVRLTFAGRAYLLRFAPSAAFLAGQRNWVSWTVLTAGLLLTGLLGALMLLISGERARIEALVDDRTMRLRDREARLQAILNNAADAIVTVDAHGLLISANAATAALFVYPAAHLPGLPFVNLVPSGGGEDAPALLARLAVAAPDERELQGVNAKGERFPLSVAVSRVPLPNEHLFVCILRDLTEQYRSQERIYRLAHHDALTGLENRVALGARLERELAQARRNGAPVAVLFIDLDHFKKINDSHGHAAGDKLLIGAAQRMKDLLRDVDTLGRLGGDEFVIVLGGPLTPESVSAIAVRLVQSLSRPYQIEGATVHSGASVGVALFPGDGEDAATLLRHADTAMYAAKREGRGNFQFFSPAMNAATHEHLLLENRMWYALEQNAFELHLQAQVQLATGRVIGAEALLRWHDEQLGSVEPSRFIPVAEESGLIMPLGDWVLAGAMQLLSEWQHDGLRELRLAVNLSARQFSGGALLARLDQLLAQHPIDPTCMELEITETAAMRDPESTRNLLRQLRARGFQLAIDDFGTGYSSLAYLKLFAIDRIKIDRGFVKDIETNPNDASIVAATIGLAHSLGLTVVAEGVETPAQWGFLRDKRGDEGQGYLFARPMPAAQFRDFVKARAQPVPGP
jgi:diguanylate cyclase (GGDEF)-like protein/PAS domain S-box-containing protein